MNLSRKVRRYRRGYGLQPIYLEKFDEFAIRPVEGCHNLARARASDERGRPDEGSLSAPLRRHTPENDRVRAVRRLPLQGLRGKSYCSKICCMYTAKHAMLIRDKYPDVNVTVFYIDVRTPGKNFDEFYRRAVEEYGVHYIKGQVGKVMPQPNGQLMVQGVDLLDNKQIPDGSGHGRPRNAD